MRDLVSVEFVHHCDRGAHLALQVSKARDITYVLPSKRRSTSGQRRTSPAPKAATEVVPKVSANTPTNRSATSDRDMLELNNESLGLERERCCCKTRGDS